MASRVDPGRPARPVHQRRHVPPAERHPAADRGRRGAPVLVHGRRPQRVRRVVPDQGREVGREQPPGLLGDRGEHLFRRRRPGDQRRHPPQRGLLPGDPAVPGVQLGVVQRDRELAGDEVDRVQPPGGERGADQPVFQQQHRPQRAAAEDRHGQQRAAVGISEVGVAGEPVVTGGVVDDQRFTGPLDVAQHRHRDRAFVACVAGRFGAAAGRGQQPACRASSHSSRWTPVAPVIALSTSPRGRAAGRCWSPSSAPATPKGSRAGRPSRP